jgi:coiled-coil domain-containing protein 61
MLNSSLSKESDNVISDLLTYSDLESLKASKKSLSNSNTNTTSFSNSTSSSTSFPLMKQKRYLIVTYKGEFDRVHYPLPLLPEDLAAPSTLPILIKLLNRLRKKLNSKNKSATPNNINGREGEENNGEKFQSPSDKEL